MSQNAPNGPIGEHAQCGWFPRFPRFRRTSGAFPVAAIGTVGQVRRAGAGAPRPRAKRTESKPTQTARACEKRGKVPSAALRGLRNEPIALVAITADRSPRRFAKTAHVPYDAGL